MEEARGNPKAIDGIVESGQNRMPIAAAGQGVFERRSPLFDGGAGCARFIAEIVAMAHEGVYRAHGVALPAREQNEGIVEVFGAGARDMAAVAVGFLEGGHHAAREKATRASEPSRSQTRSVLDIAGRRANTS